MNNTSMSSWGVYDAYVSPEEIRALFETMDYVSKLDDGEYKAVLKKVEAVTVGESQQPAIKFTLNVPQGLFTKTFFLIKSDNSFNRMACQMALKFIKIALDKTIEWNSLSELEKGINALVVNDTRVVFSLKTPTGSTYQNFDMWLDKEEYTDDNTSYANIEKFEPDNTPF